mmetsp:Transcript_19293/g.45436  ORF Transcript_19293/g.45436 Transcript_19293/m.45436 type:complete len:85 (-) Transcript_19293:114-368(-)
MAYSPLNLMALPSPSPAAYYMLLFDFVLFASSCFLLADFFTFSLTFSLSFSPVAACGLLLTAYCWLLHREARVGMIRIPLIVFE